MACETDRSKGRVEANRRTMAAERMGIEERMTALALSFPSTAEAQGVKLWDAKVFNRWAAETPVSPGELVTA